MQGFSEHPALAGYWHAIAQAHDLAAGPLARMLLGRRVAVWRGPDGDVNVVDDRCPHREAPLSIGTVCGGVLACAYHGWEFGAGGRCVRVPSATEGVPVPPAAHLRRYHAAERYGLVWACLDDPVAGIPEIPQDSCPQFRRINNPVEEWATSATRMTDNFLDITHFPFVHVGTFGRSQDTVVPRFELEALDCGWYGYRYEVDAGNPATAAATTGRTDEVLHRKMSSGFVLPFAVRSTIEYDTGLEHVLLLLSTPIDDTHSYFTFVVWRNDDFSVSAEEVIAFDRAIGAEDKAMLEKVGGVLPMAQNATVSVQADKASVEWRRQLAAMLGECRPRTSSPAVAP